MKTLFIIRHAKSSWDPGILSDMDRPLNDRGRRDAPAMAKRLIGAGNLIGQFVSSPAKRARTTAEAFMREFGRNEKELLIIPKLYHAEPSAFRDTITRLDDQFEQVAIFSHNPGITSFVNSLTTVHLDNMPTCGIFAVSSPVTQWSEFNESEKQFLFFDFPKADLSG